MIEKAESLQRGFPRSLSISQRLKQFIQYLEEDNRPQVKLDVNFERGNGSLHRAPERGYGVRL